MTNKDIMRLKAVIDRQRKEAAKDTPEKRDAEWLKDYREKRKIVGAEIAADLRKAKRIEEDRRKAEAEESARRNAENERREREAAEEARRQDQERVERKRRIDAIAAEFDSESNEQAAARFAETMRKVRGIG